jgi:hypothetical protein
MYHVADSPWLGLHRISHPDAVPFMPDENDDLQNDSFSMHELETA